MRSYNLFTEEIDFVDDAVKELKEEFNKKVGKDGLLKNTAAILYTDSVLDVDAFVEEFKKEFSFPVVGCSGMTMFDREHGVCRSGICVLLMTADDVEFASAITEPFERSGMETELRRTYERGLISLGKTPGVVIVLGDTNEWCPGDDLVRDMSNITGNIAIFGGIAAPALDDNKSFVFTEEKAGRTSVAMMLLAGKGLENALFQYEMSVENTNICGGTVTGLVDDWAVGELNGETFLDRLKKSGIENGEAGTDYAFKYISNPFIVKRLMDNGDEVAMLRNIVDVNTDDGSGLFAGRIPDDSNISMCALSKEKVASSSHDAFEHILKVAEERGIHPTAFLCVSCKARYFNLSAERREEVDGYDNVLDSDAALIGFYSQGEICPQPSTTGGFFNLFHNSTIAILAL